MIILALVKIKDKSMEEEQKINAKIKDESVGEKHNRIISIKEDQRLQKQESINYSYISKNKT